MAIYKSTESQQLWKNHNFNQIILLDAIAPLDETDEAAEYRYAHQGSNMGSESDLTLKGWVKLDRHEGALGMQMDPDKWDNSSLD